MAVDTAGFDAAHLELWTSGTRSLILLDRSRLTIGTSAANDIVVHDDPTVSRLHAIFERLPAGWTVRDLGSRNGTTLNHEPLTAERALRDRDELVIGHTRLRFHAGPATPSPTTPLAVAAPALTRREREVLVALCAPLAAGTLLTEPASVRDVAAALVLTESAVKKHLLRLYDKFGIPSDTPRRRATLANEALGRNAIALRDLEPRAGHR